MKKIESVADIKLPPLLYRDASSESLWLCSLCAVEKNSAHRFHQLQALEEKKKQDLLKKTEVVSRFLEWVFVRYKYLKLRRGIMYTQSKIRMYLCRKQYMRWRRNQRRPLRLTIHKAENLSSDEFLASEAFTSLAIVDGMKQTQTFSYITEFSPDPVNPVFEEVVVIPGVTGNGTIALTVATKDDFHCRLLGQLCISLRDNEIYAKGGHINRRLGEIQVRKI